MMRSIPKPLYLALIFTVFFFVFQADACAYLDPGTGSYILQLMIAGIASAVLALKVFWEKAAQIWKKIFGRKDKAGK